MTVRAIDGWVNVSMAEMGRPDYLVEVAGRYFKQGEDFFRNYSLEETLKTMDEVGIDISGQSAKDLSPYMGRVHFGYLVTVCSSAEANCPVFPGLSHRFHWPLEDPLKFQGSEEETLAKFREVRDDVERQLKGWLDELEIGVGE